MKIREKTKRHSLVVLGLVIFTFSGCATVPRNAVPMTLIGKAVVDDMADIRMMDGIPNPAFQKDILDAIKSEDEALFPVGADGIKEYPVLVVSGGGANGAYGAGLLKGWSKSGTRPVFKAVTGVSTGALIAPFAFLGSDYDETLEDYYTTTSTKDVMYGKGPLDALNGDSLSGTQPLADQIARIVTPELLKKIAAEHRRGRRLFVGTVNLDAQRFVVWNMGAIALRGDVELFRKVELASAAIPIVFPPVHLSVKANGGTYDEMHVDGGTMTQMFSLYKVMESMEDAIKAAGLDLAKLRAKYYFIRNGYVTGTYKKVENKLSSIADRAFETVINSQGVGDTYRIYEFMQKRGNDYNLAFIPGDFRPETKEMFDPAAMRQLFDRGYQDAANGYSWHKVPPGLNEPAK
jgi:predicted acylesterase/phospholipase RssA